MVSVMMMDMDMAVTIKVKYEKEDSSKVKKGNMLTELKTCDILWSKKPDPV